MGVIGARCVKTTVDCNIFGSTSKKQEWTPLLRQSRHGSMVARFLSSESCTIVNVFDWI
jgi:hypothetical protein